MKNIFLKKKLILEFGLKRCLLRTVVMIIIIFIGETVPKFGKILSLIGGSSVTIMTFVFPPLFYWKLKQSQPDDKLAIQFVSFTINLCYFFNFN